jgi:hypothetical protein
MIPKITITPFASAGDIDSRLRTKVVSFFIDKSAKFELLAKFKI